MKEMVTVTTASQWLCGAYSYTVQVSVVHGHLLPEHDEGDSFTSALERLPTSAECSRCSNSTSRVWGLGLKVWGC